MPGFALASLITKPNTAYCLGVAACRQKVKALQDG